MEWPKLLFDFFREGGACGVFLAYGVWATWLLGKERASCLDAVTKARNKADEINDKIREWMMVRVGE